MSSLGEDDAGKQLEQAVPWVSDPQEADDETRRLQEEIIEAAKRLERESPNFPTQPPDGSRTAVALRTPPARVDKASSEERARRIWAQLKPEFMSPPSQETFSVLSPNMAMAAGFFGAMVVSAIIALVAVNVVRHRTVSADVSTQERAAKDHSLTAATLSDLAKVSQAQAKMTRADEPTVLPETLPAAAPSNEIAAPGAYSAPTANAVRR